MSRALQEVLAILLMMPQNINSYVVSMICHGIAWLIVGCITNVTKPTYQTREEAQVQRSHNLHDNSSEQDRTLGYRNPQAIYSCQDHRISTSSPNRQA
jgi:hypothetical protein